MLYNDWTILCKKTISLLLPKKYLGTLALLSIILVASINVSFLLPTSTFCSGVLADEKFWKIPFSSQIDLRTWLLNSMSLSLLNSLLQTSLIFSPFLMKMIISSAVSLISSWYSTRATALTATRSYYMQCMGLWYIGFYILRKITHVYLEYSLTITRVYLLSPILCTPCLVSDCTWAKDIIHWMEFFYASELIVLKFKWERRLW